MVPSRLSLSRSQDKFLGSSVDLFPNQKADFEAEMHDYVPFSFSIPNTIPTKAKILLKFFYLVGTRKLEVIETITW